MSYKVNIKQKTTIKSNHTYRKKRKIMHGTMENVFIDLHDQNEKKKN